MANPKKPKLQKTKRRQAWDAFKSGYDRKGMDGEPIDIKSKIGQMILGKDREIDQDSDTDTDTTAKDGKIKQGYNAVSKALGGTLGPNNYSAKREIKKLTPVITKQGSTSITSINNEPLPSAKLNQITKYIDSGNPKKLVNAGNAILKYTKQGYDMKRLAQYWVEKSQQPGYQESIEELKKLAGIK